MGDFQRESESTGARSTSAREGLDVPSLAPGTEFLPEEVAPGVWVLAFPVGQVYVWDWGDGLTLIDSGVVGQGPAILRGIQALERSPCDVREIVLTHAHPDHIGSAADLAERTGADVLTHPADATVARGEATMPPPVLMDWERPLAAMVLSRVVVPPPVRIEREVMEGQAVGGGRGIVLEVPGHTPGSIAVFVPDAGVLFTGDSIATREGIPVLGVFNLDRAAAVAAVRKQAALPVRCLCVGHGSPLRQSAGGQLQALAAGLS